jgi:protein-L-isoaspartate(D-aspartate) O-methyltransferase
MLPAVAPEYDALMAAPSSRRLVAGLLSVVCLATVCICAIGQAADSYQSLRRSLLEEIANDVRDTAAYLNKRALDERVMAAMAAVPRHEFVPEAERRHAYENRPLPIGHGQTISQPYIVAVMTDLLEPKPGCHALEVGTGSGYQAAVLSHLCADVYTIEIIDALGIAARERLQRLAYQNVFVRLGDGYYGWREQAPFDVIVVTAVATQIPPPLLSQLKPGGRMVLPVGSRFTTQQLVVLRKGDDGRITTREVLPVAFVPLTGDHE